MDIDPALQHSQTRLLEILRERDPLLDIILRSHLLVEELLRDLATAYAFSPDYISSLRLTFHQKLQLARAFNARHVDEPIWKAIAALNSLRNDLAHRLTSDEREQRVRLFITSVNEDLPKEVEVYAGESTVEEVALALSYIVGSLASMRSEYRRRANVLHLMTRAEARCFDGSVG